MADRKLILFSAISLDGFIAREDGTYDWLHDDDYAEGVEDYGYDRFLAEVDTILMGYNTYRDVVRHGDVFPYEGTENYVFTHRETVPDDPYVTFVGDDIEDFVSRLKNEKGKKNIWLVGGGQINSILSHEALVDEMILTYIPITLGRGIKILNGDAFDKRFALYDSKVYDNGFVQLYLRAK